MKEKNNDAKISDDIKKKHLRTLNNDQWKVITGIFGTILVFLI